VDQGFNIGYQLPAQLPALPVEFGKYNAIYQYAVKKANQPYSNYITIDMKNNKYSTLPQDEITDANVKAVINNGIYMIVVRDNSFEAKTIIDTLTTLGAEFERNIDITAIPAAPIIPNAPIVQNAPRLDEVGLTDEEIKEKHENPFKFKEGKDLKFIYRMASDLYDTNQLDVSFFNEKLLKLEEANKMYNKTFVWDSKRVYIDYNRLNNIYVAYNSKEGANNDVVITKKMKVYQGAFDRELAKLSSNTIEKDSILYYVKETRGSDGNLLVGDIKELRTDLENGDPRKSVGLGNLNKMVDKDTVIKYYQDVMKFIDDLLEKTSKMQTLNYMMSICTKEELIKLGRAWKTSEEVIKIGN
jgi:hypothetical protein